MGSPVSAGVSYDVLAIMDVLQTQGVDASLIDAVGDVIGHADSYTLDVLKTCGVPALKVVAVRRALMSHPSPTLPVTGESYKANSARQVPMLCEALVMLRYALRCHCHFSVCPRCSRGSGPGGDHDVR